MIDYVIELDGIKHLVKLMQMDLTILAIRNGKCLRHLYIFDTASYLGNFQFIERKTNARKMEMGWFSHSLTVSADFTPRTG